MKKTSKRILGIALAALLIAVALVGGVSATTHDHSSWNGITTLPTVAGSYYLNADVTLSSTWSVPSGTTNLCLNGHVIKMTGLGSVITVNSGATLNLYDCNTTTTHKFTPNKVGLWVLDETSGTKSVTGGCITGGNTGSDDTIGGGVSIYDGGKFTMNGGNIVGNTAVLGGGVNLKNSNDAGTIEFTMYNGTIMGNYASNAGGGIHNRGNVMMTGGTISYNIAYEDGGGVNVMTNNDSRKPTFTMTGGNVCNNVAGYITFYDDTKKKEGGGVRTGSKGSVTLSGTANIKDNILYNNGESYVSNLHIRSGDEYGTIEIGTLKPGASIGVTRMNTAKTERAPGAFTSDGSDNDVQYFFSDSSGYHVKFVSDHLELETGTVDVTGVSLDKNSVTITAGNSETLIATVSPSNASNKNVTWSSSNPEVATVDANGKVTAVTTGSAVITVTTEDKGKTATCVVNPVAKKGTGSGTIYYSTLHDAMGAASDNDTINVLNNCDLSEITVSKNITLSADSSYGVTLVGALSISDNKQLSIGKNIEFKLNNNNITVNGSGKLEVTGGTKSSITGTAGTVNAAALVCTTADSPVIKGYYGSVADAISVANTLGAGHTVKLMKQCDDISGTINNGVTLDMNSKAVTVGSNKELEIIGILKNTGTITNNGTIKISTAGQLTALNGKVKSGTLEVTADIDAAEALDFGSSNTTTLKVDADKTLKLFTSAMTNAPNSVDNLGIIEVNNEADLRTLAAKANAISTAIASQIKVGTSELVLTDNITIAAGVTLQVPVSIVLPIPSGKTFTIAGIVDNDGTITLDSTAVITVSGSIDNDGTINVANGTQLGALLPDTPVMTDSTGKVIITATDATCTSAIKVPAGVTLEIPAEKKLTINGILKLTGALTTVSDATSPGTVAFGGDGNISDNSGTLTNGGVIQICKNDQLTALKGKVISGTLEVTANIDAAEALDFGSSNTTTLKVDADKTLKLFTSAMTNAPNSITNLGSIVVKVADDFNTVVTKASSGTVEVANSLTADGSLDMTGENLIVDNGIVLTFPATAMTGYPASVSNSGTIVVNNDSDLAYFANKKNTDDTTTSLIQVGSAEGGVVINSAGTVTVAGLNKLEIPNGNKLIVNASKELIITKDATLSVSGTLETKGDAEPAGTVTITGTVTTSDGSAIINNGTIELGNTTPATNGSTLGSILAENRMSVSGTAGSVVLEEGATLGSAIVVPDKLTLEVSGGKTLTVAGSATVTVKPGAQLIVGDGTTGSTLDVNGTLKTETTETHDETTVSVADANNGIVDLGKGSNLTVSGTLTNGGIIRVNDEAGLRYVVETCGGNEKGVVQLGSNVDITTKSLVIGKSKSVILDLNGQVLKGNIVDSGQEQQSVIYVEGGSISEKGGKLTLIDSQPTSTMHYFTNAGTDASPKAGLWVYSGETIPSEEYKTVNGGVITGGKKGSVPEDKKNQRYGGAVFLGLNSEFTMNGGTIAGNGGAEMKYGGGVGYKASRVNFTMNGGSILGNQANFGGGVYNLNNELTMTGGTVQYNYAVYDAGGIRVNNTLYLGGDTTKKIVINDNEAGGANSTKNVYLWYTTIQIKDSGLSNDSGIGVSSGIKPKECAPVTVVTDGAAYKANFFSDNSDYKVEVVGSNLALAVKDDPEPPATTYTVTFEPGKEQAVFTQVVPEGWYVSKPETPVAEGYVFKGWYTDAGDPYDFGTEVYNDFTLYGQWNEGDFSISTNLVDFGTSSAGYTVPPAMQSVTIASALEGLPVVIPDMPEYNVVYLVDGEVTAEKPASVEVGKPLEIQITPVTGLSTGEYRYEIVVNGETEGQSKIISVNFTVVDADSGAVIPKTPVVQTIENEDGDTVKVIVDTTTGSNNQVDTSGETIMVYYGEYEWNIPAAALAISNATVSGPAYETVIELSDDSEIGVGYMPAYADYTTVDPLSVEYTVTYQMKKVNTSFMSLTGGYSTAVGTAVTEAGYVPVSMVSSVNEGESKESIDANITETQVKFTIDTDRLQLATKVPALLHIDDDGDITPLDTGYTLNNDGTATVSGINKDGGFSYYVLALAARPSQTTAFFAEKNGNEFTFSNAVVVTKAVLPGAESAEIVNTSGSAWYNFNLIAPGFTGNGVLYFQVPLDVIDVKGYTVNDVSLLGGVTTYLGTEGQYAKYTGTVSTTGSHAIAFVKGAATAGTVVETPVTTTPDCKITISGVSSLKVGEKFNLSAACSCGKVHNFNWKVNDPSIATVTELGVVNGLKAGTVTVTVTDEYGHSATKVITVAAKETQTAAKSPFPVLGILAGLGIAGFVALRRR